MKLEKKIIIYTLIMVLVAMFIIQFIFFNNTYKLLETNKKRALNSYAYVLSSDKIITRSLSNEDYDTLNIHMSSIWPKLINLNHIIIMDLDNKIFFHKNKKNTTHPEKNYKDIIKKIKNTPNQYYQLDPDNKLLEAIVPLIYDGTLVGVLIIQEYHNKHENLKYIFLLEIFAGFIIIIIMSILLSIFLAKNIKSQIFGYEPSEIALVYTERQLIFDTISDEIIILNHLGKITKTNKRAKDLLKPKDELILKKLYKEIDKTSSVFSGREIILSSGKVFISSLFIKNLNNNLDILFIIKQGDRIKKMAREITGVAQIINSMRANVHEFKNKIHVISGLLRLEEYKELKEYILTIKNNLEDENKAIEGINDPIIAALLITKISLAKEKKISLNIEKVSNLMKNHNNIESDDLIIIIGNLIENATESFNLKNIKEKKINIHILEDNNQILIYVSDNSGQIKDSNLDKIFEIGYSSKGNNRGSGLALIKNITNLYDGEVKIINDDPYKTFYIKLNKLEIEEE